MKRVMVWIVVGAALVSLFACCAKEGGPAGGKTETEDPNTALPDEHWGAERVVYAADVRIWDSQFTAPSEEQWDKPQPGRTCCKFTYRGDKLVRIETFGTDGAPFQTLKEGQRIEWKYGPLGDLLDESGYDEDGEMAAHNTVRYDESGRMIELVFGYGPDEIESKTTLIYTGDESHPSRSETYDRDGHLIGGSTMRNSADGATRVVRSVRYDDHGREVNEFELEQKWNAGTRRWDRIDEDE